MDLGKSFTYEYDIHGNLTAKKEYAYTTGTLGAATATKTFIYDSNNRLTTNNGSSVNYDGAGNIISLRSSIPMLTVHTPGNSCSYSCC